jgi:transcriptional regulator with XRE-family HTH domain
LETKVCFTGQFEEWELDHTVLLPTRSELYYLRPAGLGTSSIESLASYIARLAEQHCLTARTLIVRKFLPSLEKQYLSGQNSHDNITAFWKDTATLNSANVLTAEWVRITGNLTLYPDLHLLTMLPWAKVLSPKGLIRHSQAWCPFCFEEWKRGNADIYIPLIWCLEAVSICPRHHTPLHEQCPYEDCKRRIPLLAARSRAGYCSHCGRWLGCPYAEQSAHAAIHHRLGDAEWQQWIAANVAELIASAVQLPLSLQGNRFAEAVGAYLEEATDNNVSAAARQLQVSRRTIRDWKKAIQKPQLSSLLKFCSICGISPLQIFTENCSVAESYSINQIAAVISGQTAKKHYRVFSIEKLKRMLEEELDSDVYPPPPMSRVAKKLGYDHSFLYKHLPELCRAVSSKFEKYRAEQREEKNRLLLREVRQVTLDIHAQGVYPSQVRVRNLLARHWTIRVPEALAIWHATLKELGWEE